MIDAVLVDRLATGFNIRFGESDSRHGSYAGYKVLLIGTDSQRQSFPPVFLRDRCEFHLRHRGPSLFDQDCHGMVYSRMALEKSLRDNHPRIYASVSLGTAINLWTPADMLNDDSLAS